MVIETRVQSQVESYQKLKKMVLHPSLLNTRHYKVWIKGKGSNPRKGIAPSPWCRSYSKGAFGSPHTTASQLTYIYRERERKGFQTIIFMVNCNCTEKQRICSLSIFHSVDLLFCHDRLLEWGRVILILFK